MNVCKMLLLCNAQSNSSDVLHLQFITVLKREQMRGKEHMQKRANEIVFYSSFSQRLLLLPLKWGISIQINTGRIINLFKYFIVSQNI